MAQESNIADARGVTTSEFWVTIVIALGGTLQDLSGSQDGLLSTIGVVFGLIYVVGRFWLKARRSQQLTEVEELRAQLEEIYLDIDTLRKGESTTYTTTATTHE
jgi:hypothetical protein